MYDDFIEHWLQRSTEEEKWKVIDNFVAMKKKGILEGIEKDVKGLGRWQALHQKDDSAQFKRISDTLAALPSKEDIAKAVRENVETQINGNLREIKEHLEKQDEDMKALSDKIRPIDGARTWLSELGKVIMYIGAIAGAIAAIVFALPIIGIHISMGL